MKKGFILGYDAIKGPAVDYLQVAAVSHDILYSY